MKELVHTGGRHMPWEVWLRHRCHKYGQQRTGEQPFNRAVDSQGSYFERVLEWLMLLTSCTYGLVGWLAASETARIRIHHVYTRRCAGLATHCVLCIMSQCKPKKVLTRDAEMILGPNGLICSTSFHVCLEQLREDTHSRITPRVLEFCMCCSATVIPECNTFTK